MPYSQKHADIACNFVEKLLKHTADDWWGQPFLLAPWQEDAVCAIFGNIDEHGNRIIQIVYLEVPKKSGKTEFAAALILLVLTLTTQPGCQVYGAAAATRQALNVYRAACKMVEQSPELSKRLRIMRGTNRIVKRSDPDSFYAAVAADGDFGDGVNPAVVVADEVHRWKTRKHLENWDVLSKGGITRRQTLTIAITTAGVQNESPLAWRLHEKTRKINEGTVTDDRFWGRIYGAEATDDAGAESTWIKANPSLTVNGGFLPIDKIRKEYDSAVAEGSLTAFKRYFLNIWDQKENRAIDMTLWNACKSDWKARGLVTIEGFDVPTLPHELMVRFFGRACFVGIDLSMTTDLSAVSCVFPRQDGGYDLLGFPYIPQAGVRKAEIRDGMPYSEWIRQGFLEATPGSVIDNRVIRKRLDWADKVFDVQKYCFDRYNSREMSSDMIDEGKPCIEVEQRFTGVNEGTKKLLKLIANGDLHHGDHPVLKHHASCLCVKSDGNDLIKPIKPDREKEISRIDLIAAAINGISQAIIAEDNTISYTGLKIVG